MSDLDICNKALALLGDQDIASLSEEAQESDPVTRQCTIFYKDARRTALEAHRWSFAKVAEL